MLAKMATNTTRTHVATSKDRHR